MTKIRCPWVKGELDTKYHDTEWGKKLMMKESCLSI